MVEMWEMLSNLESSFHREEENCVPLSVVMVSGTPKREIQDEQNASAQDRADVEATGTASNQRVVRSTIVRMCVLPWDIGNGPTKSK